MQIRPCSNLPMVRRDAANPLPFIPAFNRHVGERWLDVEVSPESEGLRLIKIGEESPFRRLATLGDTILQGTLEIGDRIVAINGVFSFLASDLDSLGELEYNEVTVFDYRTRQTVSWIFRLPTGIGI